MQQKQTASKALPTCIDRPKMFSLYPQMCQITIVNGCGHESGICPKKEAFQQQKNESPQSIATQMPKQAIGQSQRIWRFCWTATVIGWTSSSSCRLLAGTSPSKNRQEAEKGQDLCNADPQLGRSKENENHAFKQTTLQGRNSSIDVSSHPLL